MYYKVRRNSDGMKEVVFDLRDFPIYSGDDVYAKILEIAPCEFLGIPPVLAFFSMKREGKDLERAVVSINTNVVFSSNLILAHC